MGYRFSVSIQETEKKLADWIKEQMIENKLSPSLVFRDAMIEKKREWEIMNSENPVTLHKRINDLKSHISRFNGFLESNKQAQDSYFKFMDSHPLEEPKKEIKEVPAGLKNRIPI